MINTYCSGSYHPATKHLSTFVDHHLVFFFQRCPTVFAPTNAAFAKIPAETLNGLIQDKSALAGVLAYHVVAGKVMAEDVVKLDEAKTVQGQTLDIVVKDGNVFVDGAQVVITDVTTSNGVIHVIDSVVMPKS